MAIFLQNFKKIIAFTIALLAISFSVKGQTWYVMGQYIWSPPHPQGTFEELHYQAEDVTIGGVVYHTIYRDGGTLLGAYRTEDNQVYYIQWDGSSYGAEGILYDYDLEVGDFFFDEDIYPMQVTEVSTITDNNGISRKKISFVFIGLADETEYWIEGVGSNRGFIYCGKYNPTSDGAIFHLLCYHENNNVIYVNPTYNTCDIDEVIENKIDNISIYPNPASQSVNILNVNGLNITKVEIIDLTGRVVLSSLKNDDIDISNIPEGQYFVKIIGERTIVKKLSVIK